jgi:hypothetical protein
LFSFSFYYGSKGRDYKLQNIYFSFGPRTKNSFSTKLRKWENTKNFCKLQICENMNIIEFLDGLNDWKVTPYNPKEHLSCPYMASYMMASYGHAHVRF